MSRCVLCQAREVAGVMGTEEGLIYELFRQFSPQRQARIVQRLQDRSLAGVKPEDAPAVDAVPRDEHERIVARLNQKIAALNARKAVAE